MTLSLPNGLDVAETLALLDLGVDELFKPGKSGLERVDEGGGFALFQVQERRKRLGTYTVYNAVNDLNLNHEKEGLTIFKTETCFFLET